MRQPACDLLLLHPPSVYDFREASILYGPVSDMVPSSVVFELYPIGFLTLAAYLRDRGVSVRIANLALRMMSSRRFDVPAFLARQRPRLIGIDLHWLPHAHGALEVARLAKAAHPDVPVVLGGLSASYFHEELVRRPEVDFVLRGDSTEGPLHMLLEAIGGGGRLEDVPNLAWKDNGEPRFNPVTWVPGSLDYVDVRPEVLVEMAVKYRDVLGVLPFRGWLANPTTMVLPLKGCAYDCVTCGASATTCRSLTRRTRPVFRSPASLAANVGAIARFCRGPVVIPGDLLQGGEDYVAEVLDRLAAARIANEVCFEFFDLPDARWLARIDAALPNWSFEISPESHDHPVRRAMEGEPGYDNEALEAFLAEALSLGVHRADVFFMIGLPGQTRDSVSGTVEYCGRLFGRFDRRLQCFISPMGPFLDPGSRIFEDPERFGYRLFARTLEEHRRLLVQPTWERILNYETRWMTRRDLVEATYDAAERLNELKRAHGRIPARQARRVAGRIRQARDLKARLDALGAGDDAAARALRGEIGRFSVSTVCDKSELFWPRRLVGFRLGALAGAVARAMRPRRRQVPVPDPTEGLA